MAMILEFPRRAAGPAASRAPKRPAATETAGLEDIDDGARGEIVLFTGVRYSRHEDGDGDGTSALEPIGETAGY